MQLTEIQSRVWTLIDQWPRVHGWPPTLHEMAAELGLNKETVREHEKALIRKGRLVRGRGARARRAV